MKATEEKRTRRIFATRLFVGLFIPWLFVVLACTSEMAATPVPNSLQTNSNTTCGPQSDIETEIRYDPILIPVSIGINNRGEIDVSASSGISTPIGRFSISGSKTVHKYRQGASERVLIVRLDEEVVVYQLDEGKQFDVDFSDELYEEIKLEIEPCGDIVLEIKTLNRGIQSPSSEMNAIVIVEQSSIYQEKNTNSTIVDTVYRGAISEIQWSESNWVQIQNGSRYGWIRKSDVTFFYTYESSPRVTAKTNFVDIYAQPSFNASKIGQQQKGRKFDLLGANKQRNPNWYVISDNGRTGWIHMNTIR